MITDKYMIRKQNERVVLNCIIQHKEISRATISVITGLNKATVSDITRDLIESKYVIESGSGSSTVNGGRRPIVLTLNPNVFVSLGIDLGLMNIRSCLINVSGEVVFEDIHQNDSSTFENINDVLAEIIKKYIPISNAYAYGIIGATIAIQGIVNNGKVLFTPSYNISSLASVKELFDFPIYIENEANMAAIAHSELDEDSYANSITVTMRNGIGAGLIFDGSLHRGNKGAAGEIGHTTVLPKGRMCSCGNQGCLEQYVSENSILSDYQKLMKNENLDFTNLIKDYKESNTEVILLVQEAAELFAIGIQNAIASYAPKKVFISGYLISEIPSFIEIIRENIRSSFCSNTEVLVSPYGVKAPLLGSCFYTNKMHIEKLDI